MTVITVGDINTNEIKKAAEEIRQKRWKSPMLWGTGIVLLLFAIKTCFGVEFGDADTIVNLRSRFSPLSYEYKQKNRACWLKK
ncbi:hypothetical protein AGMMS49975_14050 [Clostridia bacterium]|nr:hypothetical protein AGMMS49975_14050 [Clostridia bacterium]